MRADVVALVEGAVLVGVRAGVRVQALVDDHALVAERLGGGVHRQHVGADRRVDRRGHVGVGGDGEVDRRGRVDREVDVGVEVEDRDDLLVRQRGGPLRAQLLVGQADIGLVGVHRLLSAFRRGDAREAIGWLRSGVPGSRETWLQGNTASSALAARRGREARRRPRCRGLDEGRGAPGVPTHRRARMASLQPIRLRGLDVRNRIWVSPMCQYSARGRRAARLAPRAPRRRSPRRRRARDRRGDRRLPEGRISPEDTGIWNDAQRGRLGADRRFVHAQGALAGIQLAHAGRKASTLGRRGWDRGCGRRRRRRLADRRARPRSRFDGLRATRAELDARRHRRRSSTAFAAAAAPRVAAGFHVLEIHAAHGYLLHEFLSPLSQPPRRTSTAARSRTAPGCCSRSSTPCAAAVPRRCRCSSGSPAPTGPRAAGTSSDSVASPGCCAEHGVDLFDVSSGGNVAGAQIPRRAGLPGAVRRARPRRGRRADRRGRADHRAQQAEEIVAAGEADVVLLARELLRDPHWPLRAAHELGGQRRRECGPAVAVLAGALRRQP